MDTYTQRVHIEALIEILWGIYSLDSVGMLVNADHAGWISDSVDIVEARYLGEFSGSSFQDRLIDEEGGVEPMSYKEAREQLETRIKNSVNYIIFTEDEED